VTFTCTICGCYANRETGVPRTVFVDVYCHRCQPLAFEMVEKREAEAIQAGLV
jgi:hypothetical protein